MKIKIMRCDFGNKHLDEIVDGDDTFVALNNSKHFKALTEEQHKTGEYHFLADATADKVWTVTYHSPLFVEIISFIIDGR